MEPIDWSREWLTSFWWVVKVYGVTLIAFALIAWLLAKRTRWGRQFWRLSGEYFLPRRRSWLQWRPILSVLLLLWFTVVSVRIDVVLSNNGNATFTALQEQDQGEFWASLLRFSIIVTINLVLVLFNFYFAQAQIIHWRQWLNHQMLGDWLAGAAYHRSRFVAEPIDNPDQRIQQDVTSFANDSQDLALGLVSSMITLVSFTVILWGLSGPLPVLGVTIPRAMVFIAYLYVIIATVIAFRIGRPLIKLSFLNERLTASYRYALVRVRENSENIAFYHGEPVEQAGLALRFARVIRNTWDLVFRNLKFLGFNFVVNQIAAVFAVIIQAPRYFAGQITLGDVTQSGQAFGNVLGALSYFRNAYDDFAAYRAVLNRLTGLLDSNDQARALPVAATVEAPAGLDIDDLTISLPDGRPLLTDLDLDLAPGDSLLVQGPSGSGKTTLLRSLAGLWPHVEGTIAAPPAEQVMFCSQQPYLPLGTLRSALAYPVPAEALADEPAREVLQAVQLGHLVDRLDEEIDWARTLSPGEQQRLAFGRIALARPSLVFLDETTAALDEGMEQAMYALIRSRTPQVTIVSVGHRSSLQALHGSGLRLLDEGRWETSALAH